MINQEAISGAYPLANILARKGQHLSVSGDSPLGMIVAACAEIPAEGFDTPAEAQAPEVRLVEASAYESYEGINDHEVAVSEIVEKASQAVNFTMDLARNTIIPKVRIIVDGAEAFADAAEKSNIPFQIQTDFMDSIYDSGELADLIAPYNKSMVSNVTPLRLTHVLGEEGLTHSLKTGISSFDELTSKLYKSRSDTMKNTWERFFGNVPGKYRDGQLNAEFKSMDDALVVFLGANRLLESDDVPEGLNCTLAEYRTYLAQLREQSGAILSHRIKDVKGSVSARQLVTNVGDDGIIRVNGPVYNQWLEEGGSPETLMGAAMSKAAFNYDGLLTKAEEFAGGWNKAEAVRESKLKFQRQAALIRGLREGLVNLAKELGNGGSITADVYQRIDERLTHFHYKDLDQVYLVARKAVCRIFYPHTDAEKILNAMDAVIASKSDLPPREAALLVMIDYVTDWVAEAITVSPEQATASVAA